MSYIPGLSDRELFMLLWIVFLSAIGSVSNYILHKSAKNEKPSLKTSITKLILGSVAGIVLAALTWTNVGHWDIVVPALIYGAGCESVLMKLFGYYNQKK